MGLLGQLLRGTVSTPDRKLGEQEKEVVMCRGTTYTFHGRLRLHALGRTLRADVATRQANGETLPSKLLEGTCVLRTLDVLSFCRRLVAALYPFRADLPTRQSCGMERL